MKKIFAILLVALFHIPFLPPSVGAAGWRFANNGTVGKELKLGGSQRVDVRADTVLSTSSAATNTAGIQAAIDNAYNSGGGDVDIITPGTYLLARQGADPNFPGNYSCINLKSGVRLFLHPGVVLKLDDGQNADATPTQIVSIGNGSNMYLGGGGRITGNTAGQTGWTGGYGQSCDPAPCIVNGRFSASSCNVIIENLTLDDYYSNSVNLYGQGAILDNVLMRNLYSDNVGEGPQVTNAKNVVWENIHSSNTAGIAMPGDGSELSSVDGFKVDGLFLTANPGETNGASAIDVYGSKNGTIKNVVSKYWPSGIALEPSPTSLFPENNTNIAVDNVIIRDATGTCLYITGNDAEYIAVNNYTADNCGNQGGQIGMGTQHIKGPVSISNSQFNNSGGAGLHIENVKNLSLSTIQANGNITNGITFIVGSGITDNEQLLGNSIQGLTARGNGGFGLNVDEQGSGFAHTLSVNGLTADNNGSGRIFVGVGSLDKTTVTNYPPKEISGTVPSDGTTGISIRSPITVTFSETMAGVSISPAAFILSGGGGYVSCRVIFSGQKATFTPSSILEYNTNYTATVMTWVTNMSGYQTASNYQWTFTTEQAPPGGGGGGGGCSLSPTGKSDEQSPVGLNLALLSPVFVLVMRKTIRRNWIRT